MEEKNGLSRQKTYKIFSCLLILITTIGCTYETHTGEQREPCSKSLFQLSLLSKQNENGKWETHVQLNQDNLIDNMTMNKDLHVHVKQTVVACNSTQEVVNIVADIVAPPLKPGMNYTYKNGLGYYFLHKTPYDWYEANYFCNLDDTHLSIVKSQLKVEYVKTLIKENLSTGSQVFTGLQKHANGSVVSLYGEVYELPSGLEWENIDEIKNITSTDYCGTINYHGKQNLVPCNEKLPFICEQEE